jgi:hypothetical protein
MHIISQLLQELYQRPEEESYPGNIRPSPFYQRLCVFMKDVGFENCTKNIWPSPVSIHF